MDYERTLYSTWKVSFEQNQEQDLAVVELLKLMAYLDSQDLWYEFLQRGVGVVGYVLQSRARFSQAITRLGITMY